MRIQSSTVAMASSHEYATSYEHAEMTAITSADTAATLTFSKEAKEDYVAQLEAQMHRNKMAEKEQKKQNDARNLQDMMKRIQQANKDAKPVDMDMEDPLVEALKKMMDLLKRFREGKHVRYSPEDIKHQVTEFRADFKMSAAFSQSLSIGVFNIGSAGTDISNGSLWTKTTASVSYFNESESTSFTTVGKAYTEDGREISFNVELAMSRSFSQRVEHFSQEEYILTDPLVINVGADVAEISDQKFFFDLDSDGEKEEMSFATGNSGFLALDKNGNGKIDDGNELFGTKSGDGFKDLSAYDEDGNGWIDENDSVFRNLKVFSKDKDGNDLLISIKDFGVGAICLANAETDFHLKSAETNALNGAIRNTGFYLKEDGGVGTIQHVDIAL